MIFLSFPIRGIERSLVLNGPVDGASRANSDARRAAKTRRFTSRGSHQTGTNIRGDLTTRERSSNLRHRRVGPNEFLVFQLGPQIGWDRVVERREIQAHLLTGDGAGNDRGNDRMA
jgi:hypothetical protein